MKYKVITAFMDLQDDNYGYQAGDMYPREGIEPSDERAKELGSAGNKRGIPLIEKATEPEAKAEPEVEAEPEAEAEESQKSKKVMKKES